MSQEAIEIFKAGKDLTTQNNLKRDVIDLGCRAYARQMIWDYAENYADEDWYSQSIKDPVIMEALIAKIKEEIFTPNVE